MASCPIGPADPEHRPQLEVVCWEDTTNVAAWQTVAEARAWAVEVRGHWHVRNVGWVIADGPDHLLIAGRYAPDADPPQVGLVERIPLRAVLWRRPLTDAAGL